VLQYILRIYALYDRLLMVCLKSKCTPRYYVALSDHLQSKYLLQLACINMVPTNEKQSCKRAEKAAFKSVLMRYQTALLG
jgi:hypothetical protein